MGRRVIIIGGGVIGLCSAWYAVQRGHRVTILERGGPEQEGCSFGNAGLVVPSHFVPLAAPGMVARGLKWMWNPESPFYIKPRLNRGLLRWGWKFRQAATAAHVARAAPLLRDLNLASRLCFEELAARPGADFGLGRKGLLMLCQTRHALAEETRLATQARQLGLPAEVLSAQETAALEPGVRMNIEGAVYFPKDCHLAPDRFMAALRRWLTEAGATFAWSTEVTGWRLAGRRVAAVVTTRGEWAAEEFVLCSGAWSETLLRDLGLRLPMQAGKGYSLTVPHPRQLLAVPAILTEARVAVTPLGGALRFGGTMEIAGLSEEVNSRRVQGIIKAVPRYFPDFTAEDFRGLPVWRGLRPCSPDGLPYLGRFERYPNLIAATGHAMMGLSLGPVTGQIVAALISEERPMVDLTLLQPERFG